jgi:LmbE family N-acetylglucosaminyl deacetylase
LRHLDRWRPVPAGRGRVVVVAPHPDDEILGAGGTTAKLAAAGAEIVAVAVTDGEGSHLGRSAELRRLRPLESAAAAAVLGAVPGTVHRLALHDGEVDAADVAGALVPLLDPDDLVLGPWLLDGHPDHEAVGRGCAIAAQELGTGVLSYLVWAWHWAWPADLPWTDAVRVDLGPELARRKQLAVRCFASQLDGPDPVLPTPVVERLTRPFEVLLTR